MEVDFVDRPSVTRKLVEDSTRRGVPDVNTAVTGAGRNHPPICTPRHPQKILSHVSTARNLIKLVRIASITRKINFRFF